MIEYFLKNTLPSYYNLNPNDIIVPVEIRDDLSFSYVDEKACNEARATDFDKKGIFNKYENVCLDCDKVVLTIINNDRRNISVFKFEEYVKQLPEKVTFHKERCDLLMSDGVSHDKIVFCDLCCYDEKYVEGKRAKARKQMEESIELFLQVDNSVVTQHILTYPERVCLFAYRSYDSIQHPTKAQRGNVETSMQAMLTTPSSISGQVITENQIMKHKFVFIHNKYPNAYNWASTQTKRG